VYRCVASAAGGLYKPARSLAKPRDCQVSSSLPVYVFPLLIILLALLSCYLGAVMPGLARYYVTWNVCDFLDIRSFLVPPLVGTFAGCRLTYGRSPILPAVRRSRSGGLYSAALAQPGRSVFICCRSALRLLAALTLLRLSSFPLRPGTFYARLSATTALRVTTPRRGGCVRIPLVRGVGYITIRFCMALLCG